MRKLAKRILITGGAGSLGRELALTLAAQGERVRVFDLPQCDFSPFQGLERVEVVRGDIRDADALRRAVASVDCAVHLAALLPPASEKERHLTLAVNAGGTGKLIQALRDEDAEAHLILSSSVCVYGDTSRDAPPVRVDHPLRAKDAYGGSKILAERLVRASKLPHTILRIAGIAVPAFLAFPEVWPFTQEQRIEFVPQGDVVAALVACARAPGAVGKVLNVAGGPTWQMLGAEYAGCWGEQVGIPAEELAYSPRPGAFDWYDTDESQALPGYQRTPFLEFVAQLEQAIQEAMGEEEG